MTLNGARNYIRAIRLFEVNSNKLMHAIKLRVLFNLNPQVDYANIDSRHIKSVSTVEKTAMVNMYVSTFTIEVKGSPQYRHIPLLRKFLTTKTSRLNPIRIGVRW